MEIRNCTADENAKWHGHFEHQLEVSFKMFSRRARAGTRQVPIQQLQWVLGEFLFNSCRISGAWVEGLLGPSGSAPESQ